MEDKELQCFFPVQRDSSYKRTNLKAEASYCTAKLLSCFFLKSKDHEKTISFRSWAPSWFPCIFKQCCYYSLIWSPQ